MEGVVEGGVRLGVRYSVSEATSAATTRAGWMMMCVVWELGEDFEVCVFVNDDCVVLLYFGCLGCELLVGAASRRSFGLTSGVSREDVE